MKIFSYVMVLVLNQCPNFPPTPEDCYHNDEKKKKKKIEICKMDSYKNSTDDLMSL